MIKKTKFLNLDIEEKIDPTIARNSIFLDIETTGLDSTKSKIVMIGLLYYNKGKYILDQFFSEKNSEYEILFQALKLIEESKYIVTYNGISFDLKFINNRVNFYNLTMSLENKYLIDLYKLFIRNKEYFSVENFKMKTIENYIGIKRKDSLMGKDFIKLYNSYLLKPKKEYLELMFDHNFEDVLNLPLLLNNLNSLDNQLQVKYKENNLYLFIKNDSIRVTKNYIKFDIYTFNINNYNTIIENFNYKLLWKKKNGVLKLEIYTLIGRLKNGKELNYIKLSDVFEDSIIKSNNYNVSENFLVLCENNILIEDNILFFIELLFKKKMIP